MKKLSAEFQIVLSMIIFGTIGLFVREISLSSGMIAMTRGFVGMFFLLFVMLIRGKGIDAASLKKNIKLLILSGIFIGVNWIFLFESYRFTTVAVSTLCYYLAPVFVIAVSPFIFKEKLTAKKLLCTVTAFLGAVLVSGILKDGKRNMSELTGVVLAVLAAIFYASVVIINKKICGIPPLERTMSQLGFAAAVLLPYVICTFDISKLSLTPVSVLLLLAVGILHTGFAYTLYFGSIEKLKAQTTAILSYIDPVTTIFVSAVLLKERLDFQTVLGAVMILGAALFYELSGKSEEKSS